MQRVTVEDLGFVPYGEAYALQRRTIESVQTETGDEKLFLLEHPHVITLGRNATKGSLIASKALLESKGVTLTETDRGGDITYHGPGQLVGYPILKLETERRDIKRFVHDVEEALIQTLKEFAIVGDRHPVHRGVWVNGKKIASVGIRISRWVTSHGFALNVNTDLSYFQLITPCGIDGCQMTSISTEVGEPIDMDIVKRTFTNKFAGVFDRETRWAEGVKANG